MRRALFLNMKPCGRAGTVVWCMTPRGRKGPCMTNTITLNGNTTGYGSSFGSEAFVLNGYQNTVLLAGATDSITLASGGLDTLNLNASGFTWGATDTIDLGQGAFDRVMASNALSGSSIHVGGGYGETTLTLANHGGSTVLDIGNLGNAANNFGLGLDDVVVLNGDATNSVSFMNGNGADLSIGSAADGDYGYGSTVALSGVYNLVTGGDENFTVTGAAGSNDAALGSGNDTLTLGGGRNTVVLGGGNNSVTFGGITNALTLGDGNNVVTSAEGGLTVHAAAGGAGQSDAISVAGSRNQIFGGDQNFSVTDPHGSGLVKLGNGNDTISLACGSITLGTGVSNSAANAVTIANGGAHVVLNGGTDQVALNDHFRGGDQVILNGTVIGSTLTAQGSFDSITLTADANAAITETAGHSGLQLTIVGDASGGFGDISVTGLSKDDLAQINLVGLGAYTVSVDNTPVGGLTLQFAHGSIDLIGDQAILNTLIRG